MKYTKFNLFGKGSAHISKDCVESIYSTTGTNSVIVTSSYPYIVDHLIDDVVNMFGIDESTLIKVNIKDGVNYVNKSFIEGVMSNRLTGCVIQLTNNRVISSESLRTVLEKL